MQHRAGGGVMRRVFAKVGGVGIACALAVLAIASAAGAFFVSTSSGKASAGVGTLSPTTVTATPESPGAGQVTLHWDAVAAPGDDVEYYVTRAGGAVGGDCPNSPATATTSLTCSDEGLTAGSYSYTVTAIWKSWTSTSGPASTTLDYGPLAQFEITGPSTATARAGFAITVTAQDADGNTVADYAGDHNLTFTGADQAPDGTDPTVTDAGGTAQDFGTAETINFSAGVASDGTTSDVMTLYRPETADVVVTDGTVTSNMLPVTVSAAAASKLVFTTAPASGAASMGANVGPITVQEQDQFGNPTSTAETINLSSNSGGSTIFNTTQDASTNGTVSIPAGSSSVSFYYGDTQAGSPKITAAASSLSSATQSETINPAAANQLVFTNPARTGAASVSASVGPITVQEQDQFGNPTTTAETLSLSSNSTGATLFNTTQGASASGTVSIPAGSSSVSFYYGDANAGTPKITAAASGLASATQSETINPAAASQLVFTTPTRSGAASASASLGPITIEEEDQFGNPTTTAETLNLSSSSTGNTTLNTAQGANANGTVSIPAGSSSVSFYYGDTQAGTPTITAATSGLSSATQIETINPAAASQLVFTTAPVSGAASATASVGPITVEEQDAFGNLTTSPEMLSLSSSSTGTTIFNTTQGAAANGTVSIPAGSSSVSFYYGDTQAGTPTITAATSGLSSATQTETITGATVTITSVSNDNGQVKISGTGTGVANGSITVYICPTSACNSSAAVATASATVGANGIWATGQDSSNLTAGRSYWALAVEANPPGTSALFGPFEPEKVGDPTLSISAPVSTICYYNAASTNCAGAKSSSTWGGEISGKATASGAPLASVQVAIQSPNGMWWNGSSFASSFPVYYAATGTSTWSYSFTAMQLGSTTGTFTIDVTATDSDDMTSSSPTTGTFTWKN